MAPRTGDLGKLTEKRRGDRVALFGEGSEGDPPTPPHRPMFRLRARAQPMLQRGGGRRARPGARGSAHGLGPAGIPAGEQAGSRVGPGRIWALAIPAAVQRGSHASAAQPRAPRPRPQACSPHLAKERPLGSPRSSRQKSYLGWARSPGARRRVDGLGARLPGCAQEARAWGGSRRRGLFAAAPRPPLQGIRRLSGAAAGAHAQRPRRESQPRPDSASRLRGNGPPQYFRTVTW